MNSMLVEYLPVIISFAALQIVGLISPGPDFAITVRNSLVYSRKIGLFTALGISFGIMVHVIYTLLGLGLFIMQTPWLFNLFKYGGAAYLCYIGLKGLSAKKRDLSQKKLVATQEMTPFSAFCLGFFTNVLNVKAMLFFLSLFTAFLSPQTPSLVMAIYAFIIFSTTLVWFIVVAFCFSNESVRLFFSSISHWIERITGLLLIGLALKLLLI